MVSQISRTLLMNDETEADTVPMVELFTHNVRACHAATTTTLDPEQVFYLTSRGMSDKDAEKQIIEGFLKVMPTL